ncbi:hypothetical protein ACIA5A_30595 [Micromonospora sp. NPDC051300]|uniref:hypothetical protein n=1 Tax=Micromonospora sp. NPDC051300 TaxID=3364286 RepID=UPI0037AEB96D
MWQAHAEQAGVAVVSAPASAEAGAIDMSLLNSSQPKSVVLDVNTGAVLSVKPLSEREFGVLISNQPICEFSDACYYSGKTPYANQGFFGSNGTITGSWPYRNGGNSGGCKVKFCWTQACGPVLNPQTTFALTQLTTGTSVTISGRVS